MTNLDFTNSQIFFAYKIGLLLLFLIWIGLVIFLYLKWFELSPYIKWPLAVIEILFVPNPDDLKMINKSYSQYKENNTGQ